MPITQPGNSLTWLDNDGHPRCHYVQALYVLQIFSTTFALYRPSNLIQMFTLPHPPHISRIHLMHAYVNACIQGRLFIVRCILHRMLTCCQMVLSTLSYVRYPTKQTIWRAISHLRVVSEQCHRQRSHHFRRC